MKMMSNCFLQWASE